MRNDLRPERPWLTPKTDGDDDDDAFATPKNQKIHAKIEFRLTVGPHSALLGLIPPVPTNERKPTKWHPNETKAPSLLFCFGAPLLIPFHLAAHTHFRESPGFKQISYPIYGWCSSLLPLFFRLLWEHHHPTNQTVPPSPSSSSKDLNLCWCLLNLDHIEAYVPPHPEFNFYSSRRQPLACWLAGWQSQSWVRNLGFGAFLLRSIRRADYETGRTVGQTLRITFKTRLDTRTRD